ncbi:putative alpha/beta hydrolase fold protein [Paraburkholderia fungorum]|uniref:Alpha/beta hydrolase fold protein n=1 Tax=Paraburkholderia fungorum TaxID=134537 RepID=A0AAU8ST34_9BURK|nr:putative alpha/beta hydrolase fold protein [Paraburkholderia fungorum]
MTIRSTCPDVGTSRPLNSYSSRTGSRRVPFLDWGRRLNLRDTRCPFFLLARADDDITTREQVFDADKYLCTPKGCIEKRLVPGGHIGLFMGARTLSDP